MSIQEWLENVDEGNLFVCFCLFWWIVLVALRADNLIALPYWALFLPLWFWKSIVFLGWSVGVCTWLRQRRAIRVPSESVYLLEDPAVPYIQAMSVSTFFALLLCCSEVLLCLHLSFPALQLAYLTILTPLLLVGALGILGFFFVMVDCRSLFVWTRQGQRRHLFRARSMTDEQSPDDFDLAFSSLYPRRACSFTMELYIAANLLQIIFLIARLDNWIRSKWTVTFIPTFILLGMGFLFCIVGFVVSLIRYFTAFFVPIYQRRIPIRYYASHILINFLLCTSVAFLGLRLDKYLSSSQISFSLLCVPVLLCLIIFSVNSFYLGPGNPWWFGLNRNVLLTLFQSFPTLQLCANTSVGNAVTLWKFSNGGRVQHSSLTQLDHRHSVGDDITESLSDFNSRSGAEHCATPEVIQQPPVLGHRVITSRSANCRSDPISRAVETTSKPLIEANPTRDLSVENVAYPD